MNIVTASRLIAVIILFVLIFVSATTVLDTYARQIIVKKPIGGKSLTGRSLTEPLAERTKTTEVQIEKIKIPKLPYKFEYRDDIVISIARYTDKINTDLFNLLNANVVGIVPYLIS